MVRAIVVLSAGIAWTAAAGQNFIYVDAANAACPAAPASTAARTVQRGAAVTGRLRVSCGFEQGSYTVTLNATDPAATIAPKTFLVNFGRIVGTGVFSVRFATQGAHSVSAAITSNMGSPVLQGRFASADHAFEVVAP